MSTEIAPAAGVAIAADLVELVEQCREITESLRVSVVEHYWHLGEAISKAAPREQTAVWGARVKVTLERELGIDRTTIERAIQCYETFKLNNLCAHGRMTWGKLRLLLPISAEIRDEIVARLDAGELLTVDDVRRAIRELQYKTGMLPAPSVRPEQFELFDVPGLTLERFSRGWSRAPALQRSAAVRAVLIPQLGLEDLERPAAIHELAQLRAAIDRYESSLDGATSE